MNTTWQDECRNEFKDLIDSTLIEVIIQEYESDRQGAYAVLGQLAHPPPPPMLISVPSTSCAAPSTLTASRHSSNPSGSAPDTTTLAGTALEFMQSCFPDIDVSELESVLRRHNNDPEQALVSILLKDVDQDGEDSQEGGTDDRDGLLAQLSSIFPETSLTVLESQLQTCGFDLELAISALVEGRKQRAFRKRVLDVHVKLPPRSSSESNVTTDSHRLERRSGSSSSQSAVELRTQAHAYREKMVDSYRKAAQAFKRGDRFKGGIAAFYSDHAKEFSKKRQEANMQAALLAVEENKQNQMPGLDPDAYHLDLHHVYVKEALMILKDRLDDWMRREAPGGGRPRRKFVVVTGIGRHSERESKLRPAVYRFLAQHGWDFEDQMGSFVVKNGPGGGRR